MHVQPKTWQNERFLKRGYLYGPEQSNLKDIIHPAHYIEVDVRYGTIFHEFRDEPNRTRSELLS